MQIEDMEEDVPLPAILNVQQNRIRATIPEILGEIHLDQSVQRKTPRKMIRKVIQKRSQVRRE